MEEIMKEGGTSPIRGRRICQNFLECKYSKRAQLRLTRVFI